jgi:hypothetical protein
VFAGQFLEVCFWKNIPTKNQTSTDVQLSFSIVTRWVDANEPPTVSDGPEAFSQPRRRRSP